MSVLISEGVNEPRYLIYKLILKACKDFAGKKHSVLCFVHLDLISVSTLQ